MPTRTTERLLADEPGIARAAEILAAGGTCAFPTETVYGLGARADSDAAVARIYEAKGRPPQNPLIVHVADVAAARDLAGTWSRDAERLAARFWPGPLTLVVPRRRGAIAEAVTAGCATVALRVPAHAVAAALLRACRLPIAAPSANRSTTISPSSAAHVLKSLDGRIDAVLDGGDTPVGIESTLVDLTSSPARLLRHGSIPFEAVTSLVPMLDAGDLVTACGERAPSPGTSRRHYAPRATVVIVPASQWHAEVEARRRRGERVGALGLEGELREHAGGPIELLPPDPARYASALYAALHRLDDSGCDSIVVAEVPAESIWAAVRDRLRRAAAPKG